MKEEEFRSLANIIADLIKAEAASDTDAIVKQCKEQVADLCATFPTYRQ